MNNCYISLLSPFLNRGVTLADFQSSGNIPLAKELLNIIEIGVAIKSTQARISRLDIPSRPAPLDLDLFSFLKRAKPDCYQWRRASLNLSLRLEIYSWKLEPLLKGGSLASLEPVVEKWSLKGFDKAVELVIETPFSLNSLNEDLPVLREVSSLITCHFLRGSPSDSLNLFL